MKILQLAPRFPFPPDDGGKIVMANTYKEFYNLGVNVMLFSTNREKTLYHDSIIEANKYGNSILFHYNSKNNLPKIVKSIITNKSIYIQKFYSKKLIKAVDNLIQSYKPDILHAEHTCMSKLCLHFRDKYNIPFGIRLHNIEHDIWQRYASNSNNLLKRIYTQHQANLLKDEELYLIEQANINFAITDIERDKLLSLTTKNNIITASVGVYLDHWIPSRFEKRNPFQMIIATTFNWQPNVDALYWFLENVMPIVREKEPRAKLLILGKNPPKKLKKYSDIGADVIGYVPNIQDLVRESGIYIAPLFVGAGIRIKILEAMAMEMPVVATSISALGINADETNGLFIEDDPIKYADKILELMQNDEQRNKAGINAREFIKNSFDWNKNVKIIVDAYKKITENNKN